MAHSITTTISCPLCLNDVINPYFQDKTREYWQCMNCQLVFVCAHDFLNRDEEKRVYDQHQNNPFDKNYRKFLNKLLIPLIKKLPKNAKGLDFGSGPGPTVSVMLKEKGYKVENYDIFYSYHPELLKNTYDFITCTEVVEHLHQPAVVFELLSQCLKPNALLGIMTKRVLTKDTFSTWHYKNDPTHVCFYTEDTFEYIAKRWHFELSIVESDVVILTRK